MDLTFLKSTRFYALLFGCVAKFFQDGVTVESFLQNFVIFVTGFIAIRTVDRLGEKVGNK